VSQQNNTETDYWEDILSEIDMDFLPLEYINLIIVTFDDDEVWEIDLAKQREDQDVEQTLGSFFEEYEHKISQVDFRLNNPKLIKDISKRTRRFLKLNK
jgi:hypothetical protein